MKRALVGLVAIPLLAAGLAACTPSPSPSTPTPQRPLSSLPHIELIAPLNSSYYWDAVKAGALAAAKDREVNVSFNGPTEAGDVEGELNLLRAALGHGLVGIGIAPPLEGMEEVAAALVSAKAAGTPVVSIDRPVAGSDVPITTVMSNNPWIGEQTARRLIPLIGSKGQVVIVTNDADPAASDRAKAFGDYLKKNAANVKFATTDVKAADRASAKTATAGVLSGGSAPAAIYATTGDLTLGVADAVKAAGKSAGKVIIVGADADPDEVKLVKDGTIAGAFAQNPFNIGYQTVVLLVEATKGNLPTTKTFMSDAVWYTKDNLDTAAVTHIINPTT